MDPDEFLVLIRRLPDTSQFTAVRMAEHHGDAEDWEAFLQWGEDRQLAAAIHDMTVLVAQAAGNWRRGKAPDIPQWERPTGKLKRLKKKPLTVAEVIARLSGGNIPMITPGADGGDD